MKINAYGKINLTLDVVGRREDGYHLLDTVMQTISVWDELEIQHSRQPGVHLQCNRESLPTDSKNTAFRAAKFFLEDRGLQNEGVYIFIKKHIPSRSGMGGGSADAAAVLRGLNEMYETKLSAEKLMELGVKVGADVPFCVIGGAARCTGTGAQVEPIAPMPECWLVVCKPPTGMSTPRAYALLDQYPLSSIQATPRMLEAMAVGSLKRIGRSLANRFDETLRMAPVRALKRAMTDAGALGAMMTGSGSSVYGIFETEQRAREAMEQMVGMGKIFLAKPCAGI
ncbi:4-(cytidine 5'-diphospho)-2-C-methyl-D-erythritol kinase [Acutalibacter muris]|jgi:4-diphosphocytidyl-2-C-methyl-D-erythritol kinase|uniref:4-diphosphocytidyl-2-C-methyl-D-erythritol kinase n=1 Tax=Acutalibacter muris TaxID=1796620 RepID=A0A1Z2XU46_9FIRM|nr:4-(cytidine 5'-diphospho)-2-C-methyl-D-erythritol kinase [Acutalibacter muris]ANU54818.1 4-(cytidine 5'-diphospho)-2-C-methyl-D-erythritol kinase [Hungateiclostridiaceae bacterium KB18]ASB41955.1 4-(cytidine 5'-diphospho)-2-C-methyl-D-erythritol kinase [Acutalibacter muris]QQR31221.1 4-(cytidine 5'-diphospho)-2-C-methyl-D-erythritol kinase [Acutalibacter muris]